MLFNYITDLGYAAKAKMNRLPAKIILEMVGRGEVDICYHSGRTMELILWDRKKGREFFVSNFFSYCKIIHYWRTSYCTMPEHRA